MSLEADLGGGNGRAGENEPTHEHLDSQRGQTTLSVHEPHSLTSNQHTCQAETYVNSGLCSMAFLACKGLCSVRLLRPLNPKNQTIRQETQATQSRRQTASATCRASCDGALVDSVDRVFCDSQSHRCPRVAWQSMGFQCMLEEVIENIEGGGSWGQNCLFLVSASAAAEHACVCLAPV